MKIFNYQIPVKKESVENLKALVISDVHFYQAKDSKKLHEILWELENNHYDVIYFAGDVIDATNVLRKPEIKVIILEFIRMLGCYAPVYFVSGNHDLGSFSKSLAKETGSPWLDDRETFKKEFLNVIAGYPNVYVLENETRELKPGYTISGYDPSISYVLDQEDGNDEYIAQDEKNSFLSKIDSTKTNTLICHYPNAIMKLEQLGLLKNVDVSVAGHYHNGCTQLKLPLEFCLNKINQKNRGIITPGKSIKLEDTEKLRGLVELDSERKLIINPSVKTLAACTGILEHLDPLFYTGASSIEYIPMTRKLERK